MHETEVVQKKKKQEAGTDWWGVAAQVGVIALQGIIAGAAGSVGSRIVSGMLDSTSAATRSEGGSVVPMRKTGTA